MTTSHNFPHSEINSSQRLFQFIFKSPFKLASFSSNEDNPFQYFFISLSVSDNSSFTLLNSTSSFHNSLLISAHLLALASIASCLACDVRSLSCNHLNSHSAFCKSAFFLFIVSWIFLESRSSHSFLIASFIKL
jgi:hypothetical protein